MKNSNLLGVVLLVLLFVTFSFSVFAQPFGGGSGVEGDPYLIETAEQLNAIRGEYLSSYYQQSANIDLVPYNEGNGWLPVGDFANPFTGVFDGNEFAISNLTINRSGTSYQGLFGFIQNATLENISLEDVNVIGGAYTGAIAGSITASSIEDCNTSGFLRGSQYVGGVIGYSLSSIVTDSFSLVEVEGTSSRVGGFIGYTASGTIDNCYASGSVRATSSYNEYGGFVGSHSGGVIKNSFATGDVDAYQWVGGFVGYNSSTIENSFAAGDVGYINNRAYQYVGGFVGLNNNVINDSYAIGSVRNSSNYSGGFAGYNGSIIRRSYSTGYIMNAATSNRGAFSGFNSVTTDCYFDYEAAGTSTTFGGIPKTTAEMVQQTTFNNWSFTGEDSVWLIGVTVGEENFLTYPYLALQENPYGYNYPRFAPFNLTATASSETVALEWEIQELEIGEYTLFISGFNVYQWIDANTRVLIDFTELAEYTVTDLTNLETYSFVITAVYADETFAMESNDSNIIQAIPMVGFAEGDGSEGSPFVISIPEHLNSVRAYPNAYFSVADDIDLSGFANWNPIGTNTTPFTGNFDGGEFVISGLTINRNTTNYIGLFGYSQNASIVNVVLEDVNIIGNTYTGVLLGYQHTTVIDNCSASGSVEGGQYTGGLIGFLTNASSQVTNSSSTVTVVGRSSYIGGFIGWSENGSINYCYATGTVSSTVNTSYYGGFIGRLSSSGTIRYSYATGAVDGSNYTGGFVGHNTATIEFCYAIGDVGYLDNRANSYIGGFVGQNESIINDCYASGKVKANSSYNGGFCGFNYSTIRR